MSDSAVKVSIGIPVYNGEKYLELALNCVLDQTFKDFEVVVCDNASTDRTAQICRQYAEKDKRIRFFQNPVNLGAARNYNIVFEKSLGKYFKWAAADDWFHREYLQKCVDILDAHPDVVLAYSKTNIIDVNGNVIKPYEDNLHIDLDSPSQRFIQLNRSVLECNAVFGLIRADALRKTKLIGNYIASDNCLLSDLSLMGKFHEVPQRLFHRRDHEEASSADKSHNAQMEFFDPRLVNKILMPMWRRYWEDLKSITRNKLPWSQKRKLYRYMLAQPKWHKIYRDEIRFALKAYGYRFLRLFSRGKKTGSAKNP